MKGRLLSVFVDPRSAGGGCGECMKFSCCEYPESVHENGGGAYHSRFKALPRSHSESGG